MNCRLPGLIAVVGIAGVVPLAQAASSGTIDRDGFFQRCELLIARRPVLKHAGELHYLRREPVLGSKGRQTIEAIFSEAERYFTTIDNRKLAYILGTAYRESRGTMQSIREGRCSSDDCVVKAVDKLMQRKPEKYTYNYALPDKDSGQSYYGRGLVQLSLGTNYLAVGKMLGLGTTLYDKPDRVLDLPVAVTILVVGMDKGVFTYGKHTLDRYFNTRTDWVNARKIVNGGSMDNAPITAWYAQRFMECLTVL